VKLVPALAAGLLAVLLVAGTFAASRAQAQEKQLIDDSTITQRVQRAVAQDLVLGNMHIEVRTQDGMVSLTGFARSLEDIARAGELVRAVRGVAGVRNGLRVADRPSRA